VLGAVVVLDVVFVILVGCRGDNTAIWSPLGPAVS